MSDIEDYSPWTPATGHLVGNLLEQPLAQGYEDGACKTGLKINRQSGKLQEAKKALCWDAESMYLHLGQIAFRGRDVHRNRNSRQAAPKQFPKMAVKNSH